MGVKVFSTIAGGVACGAAVGAGIGVPVGDGTEAGDGVVTEGVIGAITLVPY